MASTSSNANTDFFDPSAIEARLNALTGPADSPAGLCDRTLDGEPDLRQQLLANESLSLLESRSTESSEEHGEFLRLTQLYRVAVLPHQSRLVLHCAFAPVLLPPLEIATEVIDRQARVRVTQLETFGSRLEITLASPIANASTLCVEVVVNSRQRVNEIGTSQEPN